MRDLMATTVFVELRRQYATARTDGQQATMARARGTEGVPDTMILEERFDRLLSLDSQRLGGQERRELEKSICPWLPDAVVDACCLCQTAFGLLGRRKHHCRLCGRILCADCLLTLSAVCDYPIPLSDVSYGQGQGPGQGQGTTSMATEAASDVATGTGSRQHGIKACVACYHALCGKLVQEHVYRPFFELYQRFQDEFYLVRNQFVLYEENILLLYQAPGNASERERYTELLTLTGKLKAELGLHLAQVSSMLALMERVYLHPEALLLGHNTNANHSVYAGLDANANANANANASANANAILGQGSGVAVPVSDVVMPPMLLHLGCYKKLVDKIVLWHKNYLKKHLLLLKAFPSLVSFERQLLQEKTHQSELVSKISLPEMSLKRVLQPPSSNEDGVLNRALDGLIDDENFIKGLNLGEHVDSNAGPAGCSSNSSVGGGAGFLKDFRKILPNASFLTSIFTSPGTSSSVSVLGGASASLDPEHRILLIEQRIQLYEALQDALRHKQYDRISPLEAAIEDIDTLLRREFL